MKDILYFLCFNLRIQKHIYSCKMILALFLFFGPILPAVLGHDESAELLDGRGIELGNKEQTKLLVNIADQSMARPEVGPNGRYPGAMRFKFVMLRPEQGKTCTGRSVVLPEKYMSAWYTVTKSMKYNGRLRYTIIITEHVRYGLFRKIGKLQKGLSISVGSISTLFGQLFP